ncbi:KTSC domain-containing protein [Rhizobium sp. NTR19]|uniref:KTSC domain-containing protein n=1 Tax=Neorhizobium turbinariae TaxID=2937795 RepID=A0ABT0IME6_9HYPH|nr:KTSC domain-containing protein [Neorhizobium turbinariae]MCK8779047.1 KTSC domain-containing protein [Neorhizobium turbinariae]
MHVVLQSKLLDAAEYDMASSRLKIFMSNGQIREFCDVPDYVIDDLRNTSSPGSYYMKLIRNRYRDASLG